MSREPALLRQGGGNVTVTACSYKLDCKAVRHTLSAFFPTAISFQFGTTSSSVTSTTLVYL
jgi:hypothetical protein